MRSISRRFLAGWSRHSRSGNQKLKSGMEQGHRRGNRAQKSRFLDVVPVAQPGERGAVNCVLKARNERSVGFQVTLPGFVYQSCDVVSHSLPHNSAHPFHSATWRPKGSVAVEKLLAKSASLCYSIESSLLTKESDSTAFLVRLEEE